MPRAVVKVAGAPNKTRWTLAQNSPKQLHETFEEKMQANGYHFDQHEPPLPRYESYDGSQYGASTLDRANSGAYGGMNGHMDSYDYNTPLEERASHQISLNTRVRSQNQDAVGRHMLYETAMLDAGSFEILDIAEVDALKKEHARLNARIDAANRKLTLESKVKDAAQNLQRLYSVSSGKSRVDTPQSPESPRKSRSSLLGSRRRTGSSSSGADLNLHQAEDEFASSSKKVDVLHETIRSLLDRRQLVERKLMRHTAAVLADQSSRTSSGISGPPFTNGHREADRDADSVYSPDEFDGIRDILHGIPTGSHKKLQPGEVQRLQEEHDHQMASVQDRLEQLNHQLRHVIEEASRTRGLTLEPEPELDDFQDDVDVRLDRRFGRLQSNLLSLEQGQQDMKTHYAHIQDSVYMTRNAVEEQLESLNHKLHNTLLLGSDMQDMESLREPPQATGHGYQHQLQYLEESFLTMERTLQQHREELERERETSSEASKELERTLQQHREELDCARQANGDASKAIEDAHAKASKAVEDAQAKASHHERKVDEYETTLGGLWEILQSDVASRRPSTQERDLDEYGPRSPGTPLKEDFSLQAFSARVQHLFDRAQSAKEQQDILRRQIQQQRDLNGKSDAEKDRQLTELQGKHEQLGIEHSNAQEELTRVMAQYAQAESDASQSRSELMNVMNELDNLKRAVDSRQQERDEMAQQMQLHQGNAASLQTRIEDLEGQVSDLTDETRLLAVEAEAKQQEAGLKHNEMTEQLSSVVSAKEAAEQRHLDLQKQLEEQESEFVRVKTELQMAKAELEGAYGSRAERAREAQAEKVAGLNEQNRQIQEELQRLQGEHEGLKDLHENLTGEHESLRGTHEATLAQIEGLRAQAANSDRTKMLEHELQDMANEFQELTRESIELEKERGQLDDLIDSLRDRCDALEAQLADEKVRWLGVKSPGGAPEANGRETTSTMVLRQEFKKMMRETRAEGVKLLRAEQEQRRHLEAELRRLRQANSPMAVRANGNTSSTTAAAASTSP